MEFYQGKHHQSILAIANGKLSYIGEGFTPASYYDMSIVLPRLDESKIWAQRKWLEQDPNYRQFLPYVLVHKGALDCNPRFLTYLRQPGIGENRLLNKASVGLGGHIELGEYSNADNKTWLLPDIINNGLERELMEEAQLKVCANSQALFLGFILEHTQFASTEYMEGLTEVPVGAVHLAMVYAVQLPDDQQVDMAEDELKGLGFRTLEELTQLNLEPWSQKVLTHMAHFNGHQDFVYKGD